MSGEQTSRLPKGHDMCFLAITRGDDRYIFIFDSDDKTLAALLVSLGKLAADKELNFTWSDAAVLAKKAKKLKEQ